MSKSLFVVLVALFVMSATAHSIDEMMKAYKNDKCIVDELSILRPQLESQVAQLKLVSPCSFRTRRISLPRLS